MARVNQLVQAVAGGVGQAGAAPDDSLHGAGGVFDQEGLLAFEPDFRESAAFQRLRHPIPADVPGQVLFAGILQDVGDRPVPPVAPQGAFRVFGAELGPPLAVIKGEKNPLPGGGDDFFQQSDRSQGQIDDGVFRGAGGQAGQPRAHRGRDFRQDGLPQRITVQVDPRLRPGAPPKTDAVEGLGVEEFVGKNSRPGGEVEGIAVGQGSPFGEGWGRRLPEGMARFGPDLNQGKPAHARALRQSSRRLRHQVGEDVSRGVGGVEVGPVAGADPFAGTPVVTASGMVERGFHELAETHRSPGANAFGQDPVHGNRVLRPAGAGMRLVGSVGHGFDSAGFVRMYGVAIMIKRNLFFFVLFLVLANLIFGAYQLSQRRTASFSSDYYSNISHFGQVLRIIHENYVDADAVDYEQLIDAALEGMLRSLDPHSQYLTRDKFTSLQEETQQQYGGIGIQIEMRDNRVTVVSPIANTPGEAAGILPGDQIVRVDGENTERYSTDRMVDLLRGEPGEAVDLTLFRPKTEEMLEVTIVREIIELESVRDTALLEDGIGYIRVTQFGERTGSEFESAVERLEGEGMRGLIIDLRNNPGGLLSASVDVAGLFFERGEMVVYTQGRDRETRHEIKARTRARDREYPIVVLINSGSASASEIVAGSLRDTRRAVVVGETSFGKGSVQSIEPLRRGDALRYTSAYYYTPAGVAIHNKGVAPDIEVTLTIEETARLLQQRNRPDMSPEEFRERFGFEPVEDKQLQTAVDVLKGLFLYAGLNHGTGS